MYGIDKMSDEYQLRRDIDNIYQKTYDFEDDVWNIYDKIEVNALFNDFKTKYYDIGEINDITIRKDELTDLVYPVGSIYMSINNTSPSTLFGGTWVQLQDTFLYATSTTADTNSTTATDGEATHTLTVDEMPSHTHIQDSHNHGMAHNHNHRHLMFDDISTGSGSSGGYARTSNRSVGTKYTGYDSTASSKSNTDGKVATNQNTGGGQAHNNMPPYMRVYMWKRTA